MRYILIILIVLAGCVGQHNHPHDHDLSKIKGKQQELHKRIMMAEYDIISIYEAEKLFEGRMDFFSKNLIRGLNYIDVLKWKMKNLSERVKKIEPQKLIELKEE